ncbi:MAG: glycosyltransferase family 39 protein, partial [Kiritimatiellia bacterium]|nr:glycosyltransferase family 39 protein [Kiritimatiellia bacterium]
MNLLVSKLNPPLPSLRSWLRRVSQRLDLCPESPKGQDSGKDCCSSANRGALHRWKALIFLNAIYAIAGIAWIVLIPYNNAPDENTHFHYSVEFIMQHHRLPVWGVDDLEQFRHAISSYNQMPALNYVISAAAGAFGHKIFGLEAYLGARLASLGWGLIFLNFLFLAVRELSGNKKNALIITAAFSLIPQVFFTFCYVNADAHSLALSAILGFALARLLHKHSALDIIFAGAAMGLLFSAKYNYFIYFPFLAVFLGLAVLHEKISRKTAIKFIIASALLSLLISGFWFIRNWFVYGNPMPLLLSEDFFRGISLVREAQPLNRGLSVASLTWLVQNGFIATAFNSFFAVFGYMNVGFHREVYIILGFIIPLLAALFIIGLAATKDRPAIIALGWLLLFIVTIMAMHVWTCLTFAFQPQGRYQFAMLLPIALYAGWAVTRHASLKKYVVLFLIVMVSLFIGANLLIARTYGPPVQFAVYCSGPEQSFCPLKGSPPEAKRTVKNFYATENISLDSGSVALRVGLPEGFLGRYRDFQVAFETEDGVKTNDWALLPPEQLSDVTFDKKLNAFETCGPAPCFVLARLPP